MCQFPRADASNLMSSVSTDQIPFLEISRANLVNPVLTAKNLANLAKNTAVHHLLRNSNLE
jgi:hypothetical protein